MRRRVQAVDVLVALPRDLLLRGGGDDLGHLVLLGELRDGVRVRGGVGADERGDLVAGGELLHGAHRDLGLARVVLLHDGDVDALLLQVLDGHVDAVREVLPDGRLGAGDGVDEPDLHLRAAGAGQRERDRSDQREQLLRHGDTSCRGFENGRSVSKRLPRPLLWRTAIRGALAGRRRLCATIRPAALPAAPPMADPRRTRAAGAPRRRSPRARLRGARASAEPPIVLKFSHVVAVDTPKGQAAEFFKRRAEELTHGRVRVEVHPNSALYKDREEIEALQLGAVQMLAPSLSKFGRLAKEFEVFDLPFLFADHAALRRVTEGPVGKGAARAARADGHRRARVLGQRLQVVLGDAAAAHARRLPRPADPHPVVRGDRGADARARRAPPRSSRSRTSRRRSGPGFVEAAENPISNLYTQRMHEVQPHLTLTQHGYLGYAVIVNKRFWEGLPARRARAARARPRRGDGVREPHRAGEERRGPREGEGRGHDPGPRADARRAPRAQAGAPPGPRADGGAASATDLLRAIYEATGFDPDRL